MSLVNKVIFPIIATFIFSGSATHAQDSSTTMNAAPQQGAGCFKAAYASEQGAYISSKIMVTAISPNKLELLSSTRFINDRDKEVIVQFDNERLKCQKLAMEKVSSEEAAIMGSYYGRNDLLLAKLLRAELNIGDFNQQLQSSRELFKENWKKNRAQAQASDDQQLYFLLQMALDGQRNRRKETQTECTSYGSQLNCVTR